MLSRIYVSDFAIIDKLQMEFSPGFNILTGETGAGKSIIVDAVSALLGGRADSQMIRTKCDRASLQAIFTLDPTSYQESLLPLLKEHGLEADEPVIILAREINRQGRNVCRVNDKVVTLGLLREIGQRLVDIHNQGEHLGLLRVKEHLEYLDRYAGLITQRKAVTLRVRALQEAREELQRLQAGERELARRIDLLTYQVQEIENAKLQPGQEEELEQEHSLLANAERLVTDLSAAYEALYQGEAHSSAVDLVGEAARTLATLESVDPKSREMKGEAEEIKGRLEELARSVRSHRDSIEYDPQRLAQVEERLELIRNLKRKYGDSIEEILAFAQRAREELSGIEHREERIGELQAKENAFLSEITPLVKELSSARIEAAQNLAGAIEQELKSLKMEKARFAVRIEQEESPDGLAVEGRTLAFNSRGIDEVEFLISPNPGEPVKPLAKIASGGETSRFMLALKTVLSAADPVPTLIFDEIDAGLGARGGEVIGRKLWGLSTRHQVLCVTHLPQLAAFGDLHFRVEKVVTRGRTVTRVKPLTLDGRIEELALMLGQATEAIQMSAQEIYQSAQEVKSTNRQD